MKFSFLKKFFLDLLWPQFCLGCQREGNLICPDCLSLIEVLEYQFCPFCKTAQRVLDKGTCLSHRSKHLKGLFAAASYHNFLVRRLIKNFKYQPFLKNLSEPLAFLIITHFSLIDKKEIFQPVDNSFFIPIPLLASRQRWRGFNQAEEITKILSLYFDVPYQVNNLIKIKKTQPQTELKEKEREENIKAAFRVCKPKDIQGKKIFLIDDVFTTGATMEEAAKTLKEAGADKVWGIVAARE